MTAVYFAVPDSDDPTQISHWRQPEGCYAGPMRGHDRVLMRADMPEHLQGRRTQETAEWIAQWYTTNRVPWLARMRAAIDASPIEHAGRYSAITGRCCKCNKQLKDVPSVRGGVGPDCADKFTFTQLRQLEQAVTAARRALQAAAA